MVLSDWLIYILGGLAVGSAFAFALGSSLNLKRGRDTLQWLRSALPALGERTTMEWLGTSVVKLNIAKANKPFKSIEILVVMEPRDVPPFWLHGHLNGRRDTLIVRGNLRQPPAFETELVQPRLWTGREALDEIDQKAWNPVALDDRAPQGGPYIALASSAAGASHLQAWFGRSLQLTPNLARISVRRSAQYQLQWHSSLPNRKVVSAAQLIGLVQQIGRESSSGTEGG
jgi:hypothetical protein